MFWLPVTKVRPPSVGSIGSEEKPTPPTSKRFKPSKALFGPWTSSAVPKPCASRSNPRSFGDTSVTRAGVLSRSSTNVRPLGNCRLLLKKPNWPARS